MPSVGTAHVDLKIDSDQFGKSITGAVQGQSSGVGDSFKRLAGIAGTAFVGGFVIDKAFGFVKEGFDSISGLSALTAQSEAVIKSTGGAAGVTAGQIDAMAESMEKSTGIQKEGIIEGANLLATFTNIKNGAGEGNQVFDDSTKILTDMSVALGTDVPGAAIQLGKALNDPIAGISALTRVGVTFDDGQKATIKQLVETGDTMGAQKVILAELTKEFGGSAEAFGTSIPGQIEKAKNAFGDLQESVAVGLAPVITQLLPVMQEAFVALQPAIAPIADLVAGVVRAIAPHIPPLIPIIVALATAFGSILEGLSPIIPPVLKLFSAFSPLIPMISELVTVLIGAFMPVLIQIVDALAPVISTILEALQPVLIEIRPAIWQLAQAFLQVVVALLPLLPPITQLIVALVPLIPIIVKIQLAWLKLLPVLLPIVEMFVKLAAILIGGLAKAITFVVGLFTDFDGTLRGIEDAAGAVWEFFQNLPGVIWDLLKEAPDWLVDIGKQILTGALNGLMVALPQIAQFFFDLPFNILGLLIDAGNWLVDTGIKVIIGLVAGVIDAAPRIWKFFWDLPGNIWDAIGDAASWLRNAGINIINGLTNGLWDTAKNIWEFFWKLPGNIYEAIGKSWEWLISVGENLIHGLVEGIKRAWHLVEDKLGELADKLPGWIKGPLGIDSPSKVFAGLGVNLGEGMALGIGRSEALVSKAAAQLAKSAVVSPAWGSLGTPSAMWHASDVVAQLNAGRLVTATSGAADHSVTVTGNTFVVREPEQAATAVGRRLRDEMYLRGGR